MTFQKIFRFLLMSPIFFSSSLQSLGQVSLNPPIDFYYYNNFCNATVPPGNGYIIVQINSWGIPPYSYLWSTGDTSSYNNTTASGINMLVGGAYSVTITDSSGADTSFSAVLTNISNTTYVYLIAPPVAGIETGAFSINPDYSYGAYSWNPLPLDINVTGPVNEYFQYNFSSYGPIADSLSTGAYFVHVSNFVCNFELSYVSLSDYPVQNISGFVSTQSACNGLNNGAAIPHFSYPSGVYLATAQSGNTGWQDYYTQGNYTDVYNFLRMEIEDSLGNVVACHSMSDTIFSGLAPGDYSLKVIPLRFSSTLPICSFTVMDTAQIIIPFTIPNSTLCGTATGKVFFDENSDCAFNNNDAEMPYTILKFNPGNLYAVTDSSGNYNVALDLNNYTVQQVNINSSITQICPDSNFIAKIDTVGETDLIDIADSINSSTNLRLTLFQGGSFQPNSSVSVFGGVFNTSPYTTLPTVLTLNYDSALSVLSVSPTPDISQTGSFTWNVDTLKGFKNFAIGIQFLIPQTDTVGTLHCLTGNVIPSLNEIDTTDNTGFYCITVHPPFTSYDPNNIIVEPKGFDPAGFITNTENLTYTVQFQNTGNAPAMYVEIVDTLPSSVNLLSIEPLLASHPFRIQLFYPNVLKFIFDNIILPDSSADEFHSHGIIQFKVRQIPNNVPGTIISNSASIIFDSNIPVQTNSVVNTIFDCGQIANISFNDSIFICKDDSLNGTATVLFPMQTLWYIDSVLVSSGLTISVDTLSAGNHTIEMIASNSTCSQSIIQNIFVDEPLKPTFNVNGNLLTSSSTANNQWYLNGNIITGAIQNTFTIQQSGWYMVSVSDSLGCFAFSDSVYVSPVGIQELSGSQISIYPNIISEGFLYISYPQFSNKESGVEIFDLTGKSIFKMNLPMGSTLQKINLPNFSNGLYNCVIISGDFRTSKKLAVINE